MIGSEVHADQGGLTHWSSKRPKCAGFFVMPAGYLGASRIELEKNQACFASGRTPYGTNFNKA
eukprot:158844-Amphidinium_carterae.1